MNLDLASRTAEFARVVGASTWTGKQGEKVEREAGASTFLGWVDSIKKARKRMYIVGNGGSAAIAGHAVTDFVNMAKISAFTLHDPSLLTCMTNDYGYEVAFARMLAMHAGEGDVLVAISSSGKSPNICNAVESFRSVGGGKVLTLSGFKDENPLRQLGDVNVWLDSNDYGIVEIGHQFVLHNLSDRIAAKLKVSGS
ncbi:MAG: SIS domain-containing protein [Pseudomonadota bacterium]